jgi:hypothetical protein
MGGVACTDDSDGHGIGRKKTSFDEKNTGRIGKFAKQAGVGIVGVGKNLHVGGAAQIDFGFDVDIFVRGLDGSAKFWPNAFDRAQIVMGSGKNSLRRAEFFKELLPYAWTNAGD